MKHKKIAVFSLISLIAIGAAVGLTQVSYAAAQNNNASSTVNGLSGRRGRMGQGGMFKARGNAATNSVANTTRDADRLKRQAAVDAAMLSGDYNAWVTAVGTTSPILTKINADNFPKLVQAHQLREQAGAIMTELGIGKGTQFGMMGLEHNK